MIRFCDKEVCCVHVNGLDRQQILDYFLNVNRKDPVCVLDEKGKFVGSITYSSILGRELQDAMNMECMILGLTTWEEGRKCFERCPVQFGGITMIPVIDKERNLLCFAYQDDEANRELRMLDELMEYKSALGFLDVYSEYNHVIVHGCNELAYNFLLYLRKIGVSVSVTGDYWTILLDSNIVRGGVECKLDYKCFQVYAEGTKQKEELIEIRQSVSPEFECVDKIYEENILQGIIHDAEWSGAEFLQILKNKSIGILGTGKESLNAYDWLLGNSIEICCFVSENVTMIGKKILGKPVVGRVQAERKWKYIIFIDSENKNSAWGFGQTDMCNYLGYKRNKRFFLLKDYDEIPSDGFENILRYRMKISTGRIILAGDMWLCMRMERVLGLKAEYNERIMFCDILGKCETKKDTMTWIYANELQKNDICLLLTPRYYGCFSDSVGDATYLKVLLDEYKDKLKEYGINDIIEYSFEDMKYTECLDSRKVLDDKKSEIVPAKIFLAEINSHSGNIFLDQILDGHPNIIKLPHSYLRSNLYFICIRLEMEPNYKILDLFWKLYEEEAKYYHDKYIEKDMFTEKGLFDKSMSEFLGKKEKFSSWELFVIIHISFARMQKKIINNMSDIIIYWEPHYASQREQYSKWLTKLGTSGVIINMVRNSYIRAGAILHSLDGRDNNAISKITGALMFPNEEKKKYENWTRIVLKFENLKLNAEEELKNFCNKVGMDWSDALIAQQSSDGKQAIFDISSVYRKWDNYLSIFDCFRISLITGLWQKEYGYPYEKILDFSRVELQEMFLKKFKFEKDWCFVNDEIELKYLEWRQKVMEKWLWNIRKKEVMGESCDGIEEYEIQDCSGK